MIRPSAKDSQYAHSEGRADYHNQHGSPFPNCSRAVEVKACSSFSCRRSGWWCEPPPLGRGIGRGGWIVLRRGDGNALQIAQCRKASGGRRRCFPRRCSGTKQVRVSELYPIVFGTRIRSTCIANAAARMRACALTALVVNADEASIRRRVNASTRSRSSAMISQSEGSDGSFINALSHTHVTETVSH